MTLCVSSWELEHNCGYEEALHSNGEVLVLPEKGDQIGQEIKCQLVKTVECGCQGGRTGVPSWIQLADPVEY